MSFQILNNVSSLEAQNSLSMTQAKLSQTLQALSSGQRINSGADDAAGLAIANGLQANITALTQSVQNATDGVGMLQVADGALSQITTLLNRAVTLATESSTGTVSDSQRGALQTEFASIQAEITNIGQNTTYNGQAIFSSGGALSVYMSDSSGNGTTTVTVNMGQVNDSHLGSGQRIDHPDHHRQQRSVFRLGRSDGIDQHQLRHRWHRRSAWQPRCGFEPVAGRDHRHE